MEEKYFVVFTINFLTKEGKLLQLRMDTQEDRKFIRGFVTKAAMKNWVFLHENAMRWYQMLKPVS